jgi:hypothetical protein
MGGASVPPFLLEKAMTDETPHDEIIAARRGRKPKEHKTDETPHDEDDDAVAEQVSVRRVSRMADRSSVFPVKLIRNYRPVNDFTIEGKEPSTEGRLKVFAGTSIEIEIEEARAMMAKGIAVRNDPIA